MARCLVLDACVLYPPLVRGILLGVAQAGLITPIWSQRILNEWRIATLRKQGAEAAEHVDAIQQRMAETFPTAETAPNPNIEATIELPDPADAHVVAAAVAAQADGILTFNLRDFPRRTLWPHGVEAHHPDSVLWLMFSEDQATMVGSISTVLKAHQVPTDRQRAALKRARLPRLGKAWETAASPDHGC